jgi:threonine/homoserine/homoserine lactone efflux protein
MEAREIGAAEGVPALGLDGLSSTAYGPEAALTILSAAGAAGLASLGPVMLTILALLGILFISYWQTIEAYPKSGGAGSRPKPSNKCEFGCNGRATNQR